MVREGGRAVLIDDVIIQLLAELQDLQDRELATALTRLGALVCRLFAGSSLLPFPDVYNLIYEIFCAHICLFFCDFVPLTTALNQIRDNFCPVIRVDLSIMS